MPLTIGLTPGGVAGAGFENAMRGADCAFADVNASAATGPSSCQFESSTSWRSAIGSSR